MSKDWEFFQTPFRMEAVKMDVNKVRLKESSQDTNRTMGIFFQMVSFYKDEEEGVSWVREACYEFDEFFKRGWVSVIVHSNKNMLQDARFSVVEHEGKYHLFMVLPPQLHLDLTSQRKREVVHDILTIVHQLVERQRELEQEGVEFLTHEEAQEWLKSQLSKEDSV